MYLCQITAIYQSAELREQQADDVMNQIDIKTFKSKYRRVPLVDFSHQNNQQNIAQPDY